MEHNVHTLFNLGFVDYEQAVEKRTSKPCCTADVCLRWSVTQLYKNKKMAKLVLFSNA